MMVRPLLLGAWEWGETLRVLGIPPEAKGELDEVAGVVLALEGLDEEAFRRLELAVRGAGGAAVRGMGPLGRTLVVRATPRCLGEALEGLGGGPGSEEAREALVCLERLSAGAPDWKARGRTFPTSERCLVMGVLNVTPDSFWAGSRALGVKEAVARGVRMAEEGADLVDIGGESTRPGAGPVSTQEEMARVLPVVEGLAAEGVAVSVDTTKAAVARAALESGAVVVNDISAGRADPGMLGTVAEFGAALVLMHMRGTPATMQHLTEYGDLLGEVHRFLRKRAEAAVEAGVAPESICVDPGIGFAKTAEQSLTLVRRVGELRSLGFPVLLGPSRKSFIGAALGLPVEERLEGTAAVVALAVAAGVRVVRVHDVKEMVRVVRMAEAVLAGAGGGRG